MAFLRFLFHFRAPPPAIKYTLTLHQLLRLKPFCVCRIFENLESYATGQLSTSSKINNKANNPQKEIIIINTPRL